VTANISKQGSMGPSPVTRISIHQGDPDEENWYVTTSGTYLSAQETKYLFESGNERLAGLPFTPSYATYADDQGTNVGQLTLVNTSTSFPYDFTSLLVYKNLDVAFFDSTQFDSATAIASGTLAIDALAQLGVMQIPVAGLESLPEPSQTFPLMVLPLAGVTPNTYILAVGNARPILADGSFGPSTLFSVGIELTPEVPEPARLPVWLIMTTFACAGIRRRRAEVSERARCTERCRRVRCN
jgi:hypothetical protein